MYYHYHLDISKALRSYNAANARSRQIRTEQKCLQFVSEQTNVCY